VEQKPIEPPPRLRFGDDFDLTQSSSRDRRSNRGGTFRTECGMREHIFLLRLPNRSISDRFLIDSRGDAPRSHAPALFHPPLGGPALAPRPLPPAPLRKTRWGGEAHVHRCGSRAVDRPVYKFRAITPLITPIDRISRLLSLSRASASPNPRSGMSRARGNRSSNPTPAQRGSRRAVG